MVIIVPVNLKTEDKFHLTIEEYLHAVINLVEELVDPLSFSSSFYLTPQGKKIDPSHNQRRHPARLSSSANDQPLRERHSLVVPGSEPEER